MGLKVGFEAPNEVDPESFPLYYIKWEKVETMVAKAHRHGRESMWIDQLIMDGVITEDN
jgi:hypothetical protein